MIRSPAPTVQASTIVQAIIRTLIYADIFEYPLTRSEIHRYLIGESASRASVDAALDSDPALQDQVEQTGEWFHLRGRDHLGTLRNNRGEVSAALWPSARHYGRMIERLPFVRLVAVTGALAMNNARPGDDIDFLVLAQPGRLWLCRLLVIAVVKLAGRQGFTLCPNFLLSTGRLRLSERNLFTAHELAQMVPMEPTEWYEAFLDANQWVKDFLPNATVTRHTPPPGAGLSPLSTRVAGRVLSSRFIDPLERLEMKRKVRRLRARLEREGGSVAFSEHECRGHFSAHDARTLNVYRARTGQFADPPR